VPQTDSRSVTASSASWFEAHDDIRAAIAREKALKHWPRARKVRLIHAENPDWRDLFDDIA
jgi:putative endonuclease